MISGKVTREFDPPKCNRGEFGHHAQRQVSICNSHKIHTPTRLQGPRKPAARVSPNRPPPPPSTVYHRQRKPAPSHLVPLFGDEILDTFSFGVPHLLPIFTHRPNARLLQAVARSISCTAFKTRNPARWGVGSHQRPAAQGGHTSEPQGSAYLRVRLRGTPPHLWARCPVTNDKICPPIGPSSN